MADFIKLAEVESLGEVPENANALIEVGGEIKRVPGSGLGGSGGGFSVVIVMKDWDNVTCDKTFDEIIEVIKSHSTFDVTFYEMEGVYEWPDVGDGILTGYRDGRVHKMTHIEMSHYDSDEDGEEELCNISFHFKGTYDEVHMYPDGRVEMYNPE